MSVEHGHCHHWGGRFGMTGEGSYLNHLAVDRRAKVIEIDPEVRKRVTQNFSDLNKAQLIDRLISDQLVMG